jgi:hypothetical protein
MIAAISMRPGAAQEKTATISGLKLAYTFHFLGLIRWENEGSTLEFCAYSSSTLGDRMANALRGRKIRNMQITTRQIARGDPSVAGCKVVFVPDSAAPDVPALLRRLKGSQTVTISDVPDFVSAGGTIGFVVVGEQLRFDINQRTAAQNKLQVSARLLELARNVISTNRHP